jgi:GNAT superfamily N-acetyltransferase
MRVYRKLLPSELVQLREHLLRLAPHDRYARFSGGVGPAYIEQHCRKFDWLTGVVIGAFEGVTLRGAAELRWLQPGLGLRAEFAVTVEEAYQDQGIGTELLRRTLVYARNRGLKSLMMLCLTDNRRMQSIARKFEGELAFQEGQVEADIAVPFPTHFTLLDEALGDSVAFAAQWWERFSLTKPAAATV